MQLPDFLPETASVRSGNWTGPAKIPADLADRRVEITGPVDRKVSRRNTGLHARIAAWLRCLTFLRSALCTLCR